MSRSCHISSFSLTSLSLSPACQHEKAVLEERARSAGIPLGRTYIPHCRNEDGQYSAVQCHPVLGVCWCVDEAGKERAGTRAAGRHNVNCSRPGEAPREGRLEPVVGTGTL